MLSLSWWENEYAVLQWKNHVLHAKAQQEGRESIFDFYKISIAHITREYSFKKDGNDSNLLIVFYVQIMPDDFVMQLHRF